MSYLRDCWIFAKNSAACSRIVRLRKYLRDCGYLRGGRWGGNLDFRGRT